MIYMCTRLIVNLSQIYMPMYLTDTLHLEQVIFSFITSFFFPKFNASRVLILSRSNIIMEQNIKLSNFENLLTSALSQCNYISKKELVKNQQSLSSLLLIFHQLIPLQNMTSNKIKMCVITLQYLFQPMQIL